MIADVNNIFILLAAVVVFSYEHEERSEIKDGSFLMAEVLQSLLKLNEARYKTLKKLNYLNTGYNLRTTTDNHYNFSSLLNKLKSIFNSLTIKPSEEKHDDNIKLFDIFYDNKYILTIPIPSKNKENIRKRANDKENVLRKGYKETASNEDDKVGILSSDDEIVNNPLRDDDEDDYSCGRGRLRCYFACKEAYKRSCFSRPCEYNFLKEMKISCSDECEDRFY